MEKLNDVWWNVHKNIAGVAKAEVMMHMNDFVQ